uniref:Odorant-binding protein n=1 Tax=Conopomorpha sinensis TaxID=940481 RepID=A0AAU8BE14_9NEOP
MFYFQQDMPKYSHRQSTPAPRRYRRDRTTGHRSQYNPNSPRRATMDDSRRRQTVDEKSSAENNMTSKESDKACALHCFMQELDMTGENGMPDKHMVLQVITKGVTNDELRDFLQETIEECFAILQNENTKDKCEFSKNLMMCLSEKGRANCDDWKDDMKF